MSRTVTLHSAAMPALPGVPGCAALEFKGLSGTESLFALYRYTIDLQTPDLAAATAYVRANIPIKQLLGKEITVSIELDGKGHFVAGLAGSLGAANLGAGRREISGLVTQARYVGDDGRRGLYQVIIEPWLTLATRTTDHKAFQNKTVVDILDEVLADYTFPVDKRLSHRYPPRAWQVQYGESDFDFLCRLMAEWGIYYFFEHSNGAHRLVLIDGPGAHQLYPSEAYATLAYYPPGHKIDEEYIHRFETTESLESGTWVTSDFDFKNPRADLMQSNKMPRNTGHNELEIFQWPGDYLATDEGQTLARIRMERAGCYGALGDGSANARAIVCGHTFKLTGHPTDSANQEYLILSSTFDLLESAYTSGQTGYACTTHFTVIPANHTYRPPIARDANGHPKKPRTTGPQTAIVTGPAGQEIWTDQYGRVKVSFHWHRHCSKDEHSSCWVRVSSPWAGSRFGGISIPRIGQEVIVDFEHGDPDRPIIIGRVYNGLNMPPWALPANATQSGLLTRSSVGGDIHNANALRFEDKKGQEELWLHAEKDQRIEVENNENHWVGHDRTQTIDHDETNHIKHDRTETVDHDETIMVHNNRTETVDGNEVLTVHKNRTRTVDGNEQESIGKNKLEGITMAHMQNIGLAKMVNIGLGYNLNVGAASMVNVGLGHFMNVGINHSTNAGKKISLSAGEEISLTVGKASLVMKSDGTIIINGTRFDFESSGPVQITGKDIDLN